MAASANEIDRQIRETREHIDENLGVLEKRAASKARRYGKIAAVVVGVAVMVGAGVLIYRRINRPARSEQLRRTLRDLSQDVANKVRKPLPTVRIVVNGQDEGKEPGTFEGIVRRVAPALAGTASSAVLERLARSKDAEDAPSRSTVSAHG